MTWDFNNIKGSWKTERTVPLDGRIGSVEEALGAVVAVQKNRMEALVEKFSETISRNYGTRANCPITDIAIILAPLANNGGFGLSRDKLYEKDPLLASHVDELKGYADARRLKLLSRGLRRYLGSELADYVKKYKFEKYVDVARNRAS